jgi:hypothetical protein
MGGSTLWYKASISEVGWDSGQISPSTKRRVYSPKITLQYVYKEVASSEREKTLRPH